jgi:hypothetical protein
VFAVLQAHHKATLAKLCSTVFSVFAAPPPPTPRAQGNVKPEKLFTAAYSVEAMLAVVEGLDKDHSGGFYAYDGSAIPW